MSRDSLVQKLEDHGFRYSMNQTGNNYRLNIYDGDRPIAQITAKHDPNKYPASFEIGLINSWVSKRFVKEFGESPMDTLLKIGLCEALERDIEVIDAGMYFEQGIKYIQKKIDEGLFEPIRGNSRYLRINSQQ